MFIYYAGGYNTNLYLGHKVHITKGKIKFGKNVSVRPFVDIFCSEFTCGNNVDIGTRNRFGGKILIEDNVLIGPDNFIALNTHNYEDINVSIINQGEREFIKNGNGKLIIGEGSWIGTHCAIIGDVKIGKHCVIGANSVVTHDIPEYCVAVGNPAKIVKKYDFDRKCWLKVSD